MYGIITFGAEIASVFVLKLVGCSTGDRHDRTGCRTEDLPLKDLLSWTRSMTRQLYDEVSIRYGRKNEWVTIISVLLTQIFNSSY